MRAWPTSSAIGFGFGRLSSCTMCSPRWRRLPCSRGGGIMSARRKRQLIPPPAIVAVAVAGLLAFLPRHRPLPAFAGMVRQTEIRIAPEITGRLASIDVQAGEAGREAGLQAV